jgi:DNA-binding PadR family transcriptional regulator
MSRDDNQYLGEFEQLVLLAVLQLGSEARALDIRRELHEQANRQTARGALYATLERLGRKGLLTWEVEETTPPRGGLPRRRFVVTEAGLTALRTSRQVVANLSRGLEHLLEKS